jgi:hypothetical protein
MFKVTCAACRHNADVQAPSDAWKCNCAAGIGPDGCECAELNEAPGTEDNTVDQSAQEVASLEARLLELRGDAALNGDANV